MKSINLAQSAQELLKWAEYERYKRELLNQRLSPQEYEAAIYKLCRKLKI